MFEILFKYPRELYERGELVFAPVLGAGDGRLLLAGAVVLVAGSLLLPRRMRSLGPRRRWALGVLQALFCAGVLVLLARPAMEIATLAPGANTVAVMVDTSESMGFAAGDGPGSRLEAAAATLDAELLPRLGAVADVAPFVFGASASRQTLEGLSADGQRTRLVDSVRDVLSGFRGSPLAAAVVISDGADNGSDDLDLARLAAAGVPVHTVGIGPLTLPGEVQIGGVTLPPDAPPESQVVAEVVLEHSASGTAAVKVFDGARLVAVQEVALRPETPTQRVAVAFDSGPGGIRQLAFAVEPPAGDRLEGNNRLERLLTVSERRRRVLYLEGEPRWEYKFIRRAMSGDDVVALTSWLRTTERKTYRQDVSDAEELSSGFPASRAELYGYDVVVLGSLNATYLDDEQHQWLESFVAERGGSLLALAGRDALADGGWDVRPLAEALPVHLSRQAGSTYVMEDSSVRPTPLGLRSPIVQLLDGEGADPWGTLPPLGDYARLGATKPAAAVLLRAVVDGRSQPLLVTQPYGLGTAAVLATATTWRWRMRTPADDQRHTLFWRQLLRQLGELAQQPRDLRFSLQDETLEVRLVERDETFAPRAGVAAVATVTGPGADGDRVELTPSGVPGMLGGRYRLPEPGIYRVDVNVAGDDNPVTRFVRSGEQRPEHFEPVQNEALLRRIAETTGGRYWRLEEAAGVAEALTFASAGMKRTERFPVWDMPAAFLLLVLLKSGEWLLRRRWGRI